MAIINCDDCGKEISDKSNACIHCGMPLEVSSSSKRLDVGGESKSVSLSMSKSVERPKSIEWFERLMIGSFGIGMLNSWGDVQGGSVGLMFVLFILLISVAIVLWASRKRSKIAKWLNAASVILGVVALITVFQSASVYGSVLFNNAVHGNDVAILLLQSLIQILAVYFLFKKESEAWFEKKS